MPTAILGRGLSLKKYMDYSGLFEQIYIVNSFVEEIALMGIEHFTNKNVIHIVGVGKHNPLPQHIYKALNISSVQTNRFGSFRQAPQLKKMGLQVLKLPQQMLQRGYRTDVDWKQASTYAPQMSYPDLISKINGSGGKERGWPTTGILAIDFALCTSNLDEVYLFGFDLYAEHYLVKKMLKHHGRKTPKAKMMFCHLNYLVQEFGQCQFYCVSSVKIDQPNWVNI